MPGRRLRRRIGLGLALAAGAIITAPVSAASADAAFAGSAIQSPAAGAKLFYNGDSGSGSLHLTGVVSAAQANAQGDLYCYSSSGMTPTKVATGINVASGSFNLDVSLAPIAGQACQLALVPAGTQPVGSAALAPYAGPVISVSEQYSRSSSGNQWGFYVLSGAVNWSFALQSLGGCPVTSSYATDPATLVSYSLFDGDGCLPAASGIAPAVNSRSALQVDGLNAYPPAAISGLAGEGGFEPLTWSTTYASGSHDGVTVQEQDVPVVCAPPGGYPPTADVCPSLTAAGIAVKQTSTIVPGGQVTRITQTYSSSDGRAHTVDLLLGQAIQAPGTGEFPGFEFPTQTQFAAHAAPDAFTLFPKGPSSILVIGDSVATPSAANPIGAITYSVPPTDADFISATGSTVAEMLLHYTARIPAGGSVTYAFSYSQSDTAAGLQPLESAERQRFGGAPKLHIVSPHNGSVVHHGAVTVRAKAVDSVGIQSVTMNGGAAAHTSAGVYHRSVTLKPGLNHISVVARNATGNTTSATLKLRYTPGPCAVPKLRNSTLQAAEQALTRRGCATGHVTRKASGAVGSGRVIATNPAAGVQRPHGTPVQLVLSRGR